MYSWDNQMFKGNLKELYNEKKISRERIDDACSRILAMKFKLGLFENRYIDEKENTNKYASKEAHEANQVNAKRHH